MGTCKDCKWWDRNSPDFDEIADSLGNEIDNIVTWGCRCPKILREYGIPERDRPQDCAIVESDEGWCIETGPDFGCIHFEKTI